MNSPSAEYAYSTIAESQLLELQTPATAAIFNRVVDLCESILQSPAAHRQASAVITTEQGLRFRTPVPGGFPYKVFWSLNADQPRIEAIFRYEN